MKNAILLVFSILALAACGGSSEERAQDQAQSLTDEQNSLVRSINSAGVPSSSWSEARLTELERDLDRLGVVERELERRNGQNGVTIFGGDNEDFIRLRRSQIAEARRQRQSAVADRGRPGAQGDSRGSRQDTQEIEDAFDHAKQAFDNQLGQMGANGLESLDDADLDSLEERAEHLVQTATSYERALQRTMDSLRAERIGANRATRELLDSMINLYQILMMEPGTNRARAEVILVQIRLERARRSSEAQSGTVPEAAAEQTPTFSDPVTGPR